MIARRRGGGYQRLLRELFGDDASGDVGEEAGGGPVFLPRESPISPRLPSEGLPLRTKRAFVFRTTYTTSSVDRNDEHSPAQR